MTKTTSYEISKKLKEAGFEAETDFTWNTRTTYCGNTPKKVQYFIKYNNGLKEGEEICKSYDLETLINALPDSIQYKRSDWYYLFLRAPSRFSETNKTLGYYCECNEYMDNYRMGEEHGIFEVSKLSPNESLADTAGRLLLLLHEKNLIKF